MRRRELPEDLVLSESQVRDVIERAVRAEPRSAGTTIAVLRQIAEELDIDPVDLERALNEVVGLPIQGKPVRSWINRRVTRLSHVLDLILPRRGRIVASLILGGSLGWLSAHVAVGLKILIATIMTSSGSAAFVDVPIMIALILLTLANSLSRRLDGRFTRYLVETVATWGAFAATWALTAGRITQDLATGVLLCATAAVVWGWFVVRRKSGHGVDTPVLLAPPTLDQPAVPRGEEPEHRARGAWHGLISPTLIGLAKPGV